jgi:hypothetical protein
MTLALQPFRCRGQKQLSIGAFSRALARRADRHVGPELWPQTATLHDPSDEADADRLRPMRLEFGRDTSQELAPYGV